MKSLTVYLVTYDPSKGKGAKFSSIKNCNLKHRFPFGQWCVTSEKVENCYLSSFFDHNLALLEGEEGKKNLKVVSAGNFGE